MEFYFGQNLISIRKEVITLYIQKYRDISFVSHNLINFLYFEINIYLLILLVYLFDKVIYHIFLLIFLFLSRNVWHFRTHTCFVYNFISSEITLTAGEWLSQWIFSNNFLFFWNRLYVWMVYEIYHWNSLLFLYS
jgi:hypothetical protein